MQVKTIGELVSSTTLSWGMRSGTYLEEYIRDVADIPKYTQLHKGATFYQEENEGIADQVRKGKHVYIDWKSNLLYIMRREHLKTETCDFALSFDEFMEEQVAIVSYSRHLDQNFRSLILNFNFLLFNLASSLQLTLPRSLQRRTNSTPSNGLNSTLDQGVSS
jgi:hypothetical protein